jgi:hypothetical protein
MLTDEVFRAQVLAAEETGQRVEPSRAEGYETTVEETAAWPRPPAAAEPAPRAAPFSASRGLRRRGGRAVR